MDACLLPGGGSLLGQLYHGARQSLHLPHVLSTLPDYAANLAISTITIVPSIALRLN